MPKSLHETLIMLRTGHCTGPWAEDRISATRTEISPIEGGRMMLRVCHQSSGVLAVARVEPDYTIRDEEYEQFERAIAELNTY